MQKPYKTSIIIPVEVHETVREESLANQVVLVGERNFPDYCIIFFSKVVVLGF